MTIFYFGILSCKFELVYFLPNNRYILTDHVRAMITCIENRLYFRNGLDLLCPGSSLKECHLKRKWISLGRVKIMLQVWLENYMAFSLTERRKFASNFSLSDNECFSIITPNGFVQNNRVSNIPSTRVSYSYPNLRMLANAYLF